MKSGQHVFQTGFLISLLGSLPPGVTNIITVRLAMTGGYINASWFAIGMMTAEIMYARVCSTAMNHVVRHGFIVGILRWMVLLILAAMAILSFVASAYEAPHEMVVPTAGTFSPFIFGSLIMAINPVQIPFWLSWATILLEKKILEHGQHGQLSYLVGIALGSLMASALFIAGGQFIFTHLTMNERVIHFIFGCLFTIMALLQVGKVVGD